MQRSRRWAIVGCLAILCALVTPAGAEGERTSRFKRIPTQFIAALADPAASAGSGAELWGLWRLDPGPRGVRLSRYERLKSDGGVAPAQWKFDDADWWLEEHGLIMEKPEFPLAPGKYVVTGDREVTTVLTVHPRDAAGAQRWELEKGSIEDVTHLACRSARYTPKTSEGSCTPEKAPTAAFPVAPGATMPPVENCKKQDYAVLFVIGVAEEN